MINLQDYFSQPSYLGMAGVTTSNVEQNRTRLPNEGNQTSIRIRNYTQFPVYAQNANGNLFCYQPFGRPTGLDTDAMNYDGKIIIDYSITNYGNGTKNDPYAFNAKRIFIAADTIINNECVFVPEIGLYFSKSEHIKDAATMNRYSSLYEENLRNCLQSEIAQNNNVPITINGNIHDTSINDLYIVVNGEIVSCKFSHNFNSPEGISLFINHGNNNEIRDKTDVFSDRNALNAFVWNINGQSWIMGTDRNQVYALYKNTLPKSGFSDEEVKTKVEQATTDLVTQLNQVTRERDLLSSQNDVLTREVNNANSSYAKTIEQNLADYKLQSQEMALRGQVYNQQMEQERLRFDYNNRFRQSEYDRQMMMLKMNSDQMKLQMDSKIAALKVEKENASVQSANANAFSNTIKTLAIAIPAAAGFAYWLLKPAAAGISALTGFTLSDMFGGIGSACTALWDGACGVASSICRGVGDIASSAWNGICDIAGGVGDLVGGACSAIGDVCSSVWDGACSLFSSLFD